MTEMTTSAAVDPAQDGQGYRVATADSATYAAATVVVATGSFQFPKPAPFRGALPPEIVQLHSSHYPKPWLAGRLQRWFCPCLRRCKPPPQILWSYNPQKPHL